MIVYVHLCRWELFSEKNISRNKPVSSFSVILNVQLFDSIFTIKSLVQKVNFNIL